MSNILVTGLTDLEPAATWSPPTGIGADRVAGYTIVARSRYRHGRSWRTHSLTFETEAADPTIVLAELKTGKIYSLHINAVDEADHRGLMHTNDVTFASVPGIPIVSWSVNNANGSSYVIADQEAVVQLTSYDNGFGTPTYSLVSGPTGFTLNPVTGEGRWTPTAADVGTVPVVIRAVNVIGPRDLSINIRVYFSGPVLNAYATRNGYSATAHWQPPSDNVLPIDHYHLSIQWQWSSRRRSRATSTTATSLAFPLYPTGAVWHKGVKITPVDAAGNYGVTTPLIPYNGALPTTLPYSDPVWIEGVTIDTNKVPMVEIRGEAGRTADLEVTDNFVDWGLLETVTLDEDEAILCPDPDGALAPRGSYRLIIH